MLYLPVLRKKLREGQYVIWLFYKIDLCLTTSFQRSQRELSIDVAERRSILKNNQKYVQPPF